MFAVTLDELEELLGAKVVVSETITGDGFIAMIDTARYRLKDWTNIDFACQATGRSEAGACVALANRLRDTYVSADGKTVYACKHLQAGSKRKCLCKRGY